MSSVLLTSCGTSNLLGGLLGGQNPTTEPAAEQTVDENTSNASTADILSGILGAMGNKDTKTTDDGQAASNKGVIGGILNSVLNGFSTVKEETLVGTWNYKGSAFVFESENVLANLGSDVLAKQAAAKVDGYLAKVGVKEGSCTMTFNEDKTCTFNAGERGLNGTYEYNAKDKTLALAFGAIKANAYVVYDAGNINIVFQSDSLLKILKAICSISNKGTLQLLNTLLANYDGLRVGMSFAK